MDVVMHSLWLSAERRIDSALAVIVACAMVVLTVPSVVLLTDARWSDSFTMIILACIPLALLCVWPLRSGLLTARAIEERDKDEIDRWRESGLPPLHPELLASRLRRVHYPMLLVVFVFSFSISTLAFTQRVRTDSPAMMHFALGVSLAALGVAAGTAVLMLVGKCTSRTLLGLLILLGWPVPVGGVIASLAVIMGRGDFEAEAAVRAITTMGYVIVGLIGILISIVLLALWFAWLTLWWSGKGLEVNSKARLLPKVDPGVEAADAEFDAEDVALVREAMAVPRSIFVVTLVVVATTVGIVVVGSGPMSGGVVHVILGAILMACLAFILQRAVAL